MNGVSMKKSWPNDTLLENRNEPVSDALRRNSLRWLEHVLRKSDEDWVSKYLDFQVNA